MTTGQALGPNVQGRATDIITVLYGDANSTLNTKPLKKVEADGSGATVGNGIVAKKYEVPLTVGDLIMFSNAMGNAIQELTSYNTSNKKMTFATTDSMNLNQRGAPQGTIMQLQDSPGSFPPTTATRIWMITYYVDNTDPDSPRLMRVVNNGSPRPVALDIEDLQLTYDLVDGVTNPSGVDEPTTPNSEAEIRKVNLLLASRSHKANRVTDEYRRQALSTQVALRSLSFFDRYQ